MKTVVGLFNSTTAAQEVKQALVGQGYEANHISVVAQDSSDYRAYGKDYTEHTDYSTQAATGDDADAGVGHKIGNFFRSLVGGDEDVHEHYASGVNEGGALLAVTTDDSKAVAVAALLKQHGARDIDDNTGAAEAGTPIYGGSSATEGTTIPIVEEQLVVGKRDVDRGGVRVYSHVVDVPVSTDINLRDEHVNVERRPVDRVATAADFGTHAGAIEVRATGEEAVVGKSSRVVEEVSVGKHATERTEAIHDSVRKTEVDVEEIPGEVVTGVAQKY